MRVGLACVDEENLHIRASADEKAALAEAARLNSQKLSQFILTSSLAAARDVLARHQLSTILLTPEGFEAFAHRLDEAPRLIPTLAEQFSKVKPFRD